MTTLKVTVLQLVVLQVAILQVTALQCRSPEEEKSAAANHFRPLCTFSPLPLLHYAAAIVRSRALYCI